MNAYSWGWVGFGLYFAALEAAAIVRAARARRRGEHDRYTLSSHLWALFGTTQGTRADVWIWARRGLLVVALAWLGLHLLGGGTWLPWEG